MKHFKEFTNINSWYIRNNEKHYSVEIKHWTRGGYEVGATNIPLENCWAMYCYIFPKHLMFQRLSKLPENQYCLDTDSISIEHMHGGITFSEKAYDKDGNVKYVKIGCDYQHYWDEYYMEIGSFEEAGSIQWDARKLYEELAVWGEE